MAQLDRYGESAESQSTTTRRCGDDPKTPSSRQFANNTSKSPPTIEQLLQGSPGGGGGHSRTSNHIHTSPVIRRDYNPVLRKSPSVLARVKEKAKKWRRTLSSKKKPAIEANPTPSWGISLEDVDDDQDQEEDPEYLGAPMYESELAPEAYKETARQHPRAVHVVSQKHPPPPPKPEPEPEPGQSVANAAHEQQEPEAKATQEVTSKIEDLSVSVPRPVHISRIQQTSGSGDQVWDKGVSVKEYLMQKLEPGEDEKALSQIISDAISPRTGAGNVGVVEKMKEAVSSLLRSDQLSLSATTAASATPHSASQVPVSTNAHEVDEDGTEEYTERGPTWNA